MPKKNVHVHAEIQYMNRYGPVHSDLCIEAPFDMEYRREWREWREFLHKALDEYLEGFNPERSDKDNPQFFAVGDYKYKGE